MIEQYADALNKAMIAYGEETGGFSSDKVSLKRHSRTIRKLDNKLATEALEKIGADVLAVADVKVSEGSIIERLGDTEGNKLIEMLKESGCVSEYTSNYWRASLK